MAHLWDRGVLNASSWHGLEEIGEFPTGEAMVAHGERTGAWPVGVTLRPLRVEGFECAPPEERAVVASYVEHPARCVGVVGSRYTATTPESWRMLVAAAAKAGAQPTGAFSLRDGRCVIGTFQVNGTAGGPIVTSLLLADSFDGSSRLSVGTTSVRVVCANTLAVSMRQDGGRMAQLRHGASINDQVSILAGEIATALESGKALRDLYKRAASVTLTRETAQKAFDALFPPAPEGAEKAAVSRADNARDEARRAATLPVNQDGATLATLWNAATYLVDRRADTTPRALRGGDRLDSMIFGSRGARVEAVRSTIETLLAAA